MKLIVRAVTFKQHQRRRRKKTDAKLNHHLRDIRGLQERQGNPNQQAQRMLQSWPPSPLRNLVPQAFSLSASRLLVSDLQGKNMNNISK